MDLNALFPILVPFFYIDTNDVGKKKGQCRIQLLCHRISIILYAAFVFKIKSSWNVVLHFLISWSKNKSNPGHTCYHKGINSAYVTFFYMLHRMTNMISNSAMHCCYPLHKRYTALWDSRALKQPKKSYKHSTTFFMST